MLVITQVDFDPPIADPRHIRTSEDKQHVYVSSERPRTSRSITLKIRVGRRGFLNTSAGTTFFLALLLWGFFLRAGVVTHDPDTSPGAAVLVVAPALMVLFVTRPAESALVSAVLSGVRTALAVCAAASTVAAAALAGVRPTAHARPTLAICAILSSLASTSVQIAWLGSFPLVRKHGYRVRVFWCGGPGERRRWSLPLCWLTCAALAAWGAVSWSDAMSAAHHPLPSAGGLLVVALLGFGVFLPRRQRSAAPGIRLLTIAAEVAAVILAAVSLVSTPSPLSSFIRLAALLSGSALAVMATIAALTAELAPIEA